MSHNPNFVKGLMERCFQGTTIGVIRGDARSLDYGSHGVEVL